MKSTVVLLLIFFSINVEACREFNEGWNQKQWISRSDSIYHGKIVSVSLSEEEINNGETDPLFNLVARSDKHIRLKVFETLKGNTQKVINIISVSYTHLTLPTIYSV